MAAPPKPPAATPPAAGKAPPAAADKDKDKDKKAGKEEAPETEAEDVDEEYAITIADLAANKPSTLDALSHGECQTLYAEAAGNILFAKRQQWRILEYVTVLALAFMAVGIASQLGSRITGFLAVFTLVVAFFAMMVLVLLQHWQNREQAKLRRISESFSSFNKGTRELKSQTVSDVHRYTILFFMEVYLLIFSIVAFKIMLDIGAEVAK